ncbi:hypothetical protein B0H17DRAFT_1095789 [Mycena rosella]|uniref:Uncharacterized protein n=1 Tax=Mycena rosella TaxID=1033263 RepID=A0AAD7CRW4_MYCRO|nr:hypothetical protein B0H17DRAFT_1095789 [Mycena rosella]
MCWTATLEGPGNLILILKPLLGLLAPVSSQTYWLHVIGSGRRQCAGVEQSVQIPPTKKSTQIKSAEDKDYFDSFGKRKAGRVKPGPQTSEVQNLAKYLHGRMPRSASNFGAVELWTD